MTDGLKQSEFYMWRTIFALAHADNVIKDDEVRYMAEAMEDVAFSDEQRAVLRDDISNAKDIVEMFKMIDDPKDQKDFFTYAKEMVMSDGDFAEEEVQVLIKLKEIHMKRTDVDALIGTVELEIDEEYPDGPRSKKEVMFSFREQFLRNKAE